MSLTHWAHTDQAAQARATAAAIQQVQSEAQKFQAAASQALSQHQQELVKALDLLRPMEQVQAADSRALQELLQLQRQLTAALRTSTLRLHHAEAYDAARRRLAAAVERLQQPPDCARAQYLACYVVTRLCGFACQMHSLADCMASAFLSGRTMVLLPPQLHMYGFECNHLWDCFFQNVSSCVPFALNVTAAQWERWSNTSEAQFTLYQSWGEDPYRLPPFLAEELSGPPFESLDYTPPPDCLFTGVLLRWLLRPGPRLAAAIMKRRKRLALDEQPPDVGVHVRRTDKVRDEALSYDLRFYMMHVDHFVGPTTYHHASYGKPYHRRVLLVSDSDLTPETRAFPAYNFTLASAGQGRWSRDALDLLLADLFSLVQAPYFVATLSSQVARLVVELRAAGPQGAQSFERLASLDAGYYKGRQEPATRLPLSLKPLRARDFLRAGRAPPEGALVDPLGNPLPALPPRPPRDPLEDDHPATPPTQTTGSPSRHPPRPPHHAVSDPRTPTLQPAVPV